MGVSKNKGTPKSSILIRFSIIKPPFWGTPIFGLTPRWACVPLLGTDLAQILRLVMFEGNFFWYICKKHIFTYYITLILCAFNTNVSLYGLQ